jgi:predicted outer membrane protein
MMMKGLTTTAVWLLIASVAFAQEPKKKDTKPAKTPASCVKGTTANGKSCCQQPSKTAALRMAAAKPAVKTSPAKPAIK